MFDLSKDVADRAFRAPSASREARGMLASRALNMAAWARTRAADRDRDASLAPVDLLSLTHSTCRTRIGPSWVDMYFDPLADALASDGLRCAALELFIHGQARYPRHRPSVLVDDALTAAGIEAIGRS